MRLILASGSPRRHQMLRDLGVPFEVCLPDVDEGRLRGEPAARYAQRLAEKKATAAAEKLGLKDGSAIGEDWALLAADTIVVHGTLVLGKPSSAADATAMLRKLSGRTHEVITAFCWLGRKDEKSRIATSLVRTNVRFASMSPSFWSWYVSTGESMDKAGAYAAQGIGMSFIERVSGSYSNVVGLPLPQVLKAFSRTFGGELRELCGKAG